MIRAKFRVDRIERTQGSRPVVDGEGRTSYETAELRSVTLNPVFGNGDPDHENTKFWQATPSGQVQITCANLEAVEGFELGAEYYVDFSQATK